MVSLHILLKRDFKLINFHVLSPHFYMSVLYSIF
nr:MAG TPA: hypothetical protein [Bacteriophage sp.]